MKYYIYTLHHPITNEIRYVGKTNNPIKRLKSHYYNPKGKTHKDCWIKSLRKQGLKPTISIVEEFNNEQECLQNEDYWINQFRAWGYDLTNIAEGGKQGYIAIGENNFNSKLTETEVILICEQIILGKHYPEVKKLVPSLSTSIFSTIRRKSNWKHITCKYNFPTITYEYRKGKGTTDKPVIDTITGILFPSAKLAALSVNRTASSLHHKLSRGTETRFKYL